jgi:WD40 repeat protein
VGSADHTVRLWSIPSAILSDPYGDVESLAFSPHTIATGNGGDNVRLWNTDDFSRSYAFGKYDGSAARSVVFSPDGRTLVIGSDDGKIGKIRFWSVRDPARITPVGESLTIPGGVSSVAISPDGHTLAVCSFDGEVRLWNIRDISHPSQVGEPFTGVTGPVAFSSDGHILAGVSDTGVHLWDVASSAGAVSIGQPLTVPGAVESMAFSPSGHLLAASSPDGTIWLWNVDGRGRATAISRPLTTNADDIYWVTFSPDGRTLAASSTNEIFIWNVASPAHAYPIGQPLTDSSGSINVVAFSSDGHTLADGSGMGTIRLWNLDVTKATNWICATSKTNLTKAQWSRYIGQLPYDPPCPFPSN